jgi:hypothetical protein
VVPAVINPITGEASQITGEATLVSPETTGQKKVSRRVDCAPPRSTC